MDITNIIKVAMVKRGDMSLLELSRLTFQSTQNLHKKMRNGVWKIKDLESVAAALECNLKVVLTDKDTGEEIASS